jgi:hypothetical protein
MRGMASAADPRPERAVPAGRPSRRRRPVGQRRLLGASVMVLLGAFLPWVYTGVGAVSGFRGAGLWTFYTSSLGFAGALVASRRLAGVQALVLAAAAIGLAGWQLVHLTSLVGFSGWFPGPGLVLTAGGGVLAAAAGRSLLTGRE